jgi:UDPglucose 6-dehydrogenase
VRAGSRRWRLPAGRAPPGYGRACPASELGWGQFRILQSVEAVNTAQKARLFAKLKQQLGSVKGKTIAVWGLSFKPNTDDMREAPAIPLIQSLLSAGAKVRAYDPEAMGVARGIFGSRVSFAASNYDALKGADALVIVTEWSTFRRPDFNRMRSLMRTPVIVDGRNLFTPEQMKQHGFAYHSIGRN